MLLDLRSLEEASQAVTGTLTATLPALTASAIVKVGNSTSTTITLPSLTSSAAVKVGNSTSAAITLPALTSSLHVNVGETDRAAITLPALTAAATVKVGNKLTTAITLPALTTNIAAVEAILAHGAITLPSLSFAGVSAVPVGAAMSATLPALSVTARVNTPAFNAASGYYRFPVSHGHKPPRQAADAIVYARATATLPSLSAAATVTASEPNIAVRPVPPAHGNLETSLPSLTVIAQSTHGVETNARVSLPKLSSAVTTTYEQFTDQELLELLMLAA